MSRRPILLYSEFQTRFSYGQSLLQSKTEISRCGGRHRHPGTWEVEGGGWRVQGQTQFKALFQIKINLVVNVSQISRRWSFKMATLCIMASSGMV